MVSTTSQKAKAYRASLSSKNQHKKRATALVVATAAAVITHHKWLQSLFPTMNTSTLTGLPTGQLRNSHQFQNLAKVQYSISANWAISKTGVAASVAVTYAPSRPHGAPISRSRFRPISKTAGFETGVAVRPRYLRHFAASGVLKRYLPLSHGRDAPRGWDLKATKTSYSHTRSHVVPPLPPTVFRHAR
jgi:hypothetical protein